VKIFDYMYMGKPVVASRLPGIEKIINHGMDGLLFESENYIQMAEYIIKLWGSHSLRQNLAANARHNVKKFEWGPIHKKIYRFIEGKTN